MYTYIRLSCEAQQDLIAQQVESMKAGLRVSRGTRRCAIRSCNLSLTVMLPEKIPTATMKKTDFPGSVQDGFGTNAPGPASASRCRRALSGAAPGGVTRAFFPVTYKAHRRRLP